MKVQVLEASMEFVERPFITPLQLSTGPITEITEARASVVVRVSGREATGRGSIYLSDLWAWPDPSLSHEDRDAALRDWCVWATVGLPTLGKEPCHPLELGLRFHEAYSLDPRNQLPVLATTMCNSPLDAALHDAVGIAVGCSAFDFYNEAAEIPSADLLFAEGACAAISRLLRRPPVFESDAWLIVNKSDDVATKVAPWIRERGYRCFKLKIMGKDNEADVARTVEVFRGVRELGVDRPRLTVDSNEANPDAANVLDYLERLRAADREAFDALEYLEQPTGRDITEHRHRWHDVTRLKPILLDEGLTDFELFEEAAQQGWSGFALKTCKGHSFALIAAAWAYEQGLLLSMQDLTNPGLAAIHALLFAGFVPTINGVELNSPQFTPAANADWMPRLASLFDPRNGTHRLPGPVPVGLGSTL